MPALTGLARYCLHANPFQRRELDPFRDHLDAERLVRIDGFRELDRIGLHLRHAIENNQTAFFLITGESGAGRSSMANFILHKYACERHLKLEQFVVPSTRRAEGYDPLTIYRKWISSLRGTLNAKKLLSADVLSELKDAASSASIDAAILGPEYQGVLSHVACVLENRNPPAGFGVCLEDVRDASIIRTAFEILENVPSVCVFTTLDSQERRDSVISWYVQEGHGHRLLELHPLAGDDVVQVAAARWKHSADNENPFDQQGLRKAFERPRSIGRVLEILEAVLEFKLIVLGSGPAWPEAQDLAFPEDQLKDLVACVERKAANELGG